MEKKEQRPLLNMEMKEEEVVYKVTDHDLESALLDDPRGLCRASCLTDPQVGLSPIRARTPFHILKRKKLASE